MNESQVESWLETLNTAIIELEATGSIGATITLKEIVGEMQEAIKYDQWLQEPEDSCTYADWESAGHPN